MKRNDHLGVIGAFLLLTILVGPTAPSFAQETVRASMDLKQLMDETLRNNPEIVAARKAWEAAETRIPQATSLDDPEFTYQAWAVPLNDPGNFRKANPNMFGIQQKLPFPGKLRLKGEIASEEAKMAEARYRAKEREIIARLKTAYAGLFMASRAIQIQGEHLELVKQILRIAEIRYAVGRVPQQDVFKAQVAQSEVLNNLIAVGQERQVAEAGLNALLNRPSTAPFPPPPELIPDIPAGEWRVDDLIQQALQLRPELKEMEAAIQDSYGAIVNITIPFSPWTINKHSKEVEEAGLTVAKSLADYQAMKNMVFFEIRDAFAKREAARQQLRLFRDALIPQTEQSFKATLAAYEVGKVEFIGLMEAARTTRDIKLGYYRALVDFEQRLADLERAVGRDLIR